MNRLNGWQRIGIIASVLWAIGGFFAMQVEVSDRAARFAEGMTAGCYQVKSAAQCSADWSEHFQAVQRPGQLDVVLFALVPIPLGWGIAYLCLWLARWVRRGFQQSA